MMARKLVILAFVGAVCASPAFGQDRNASRIADDLMACRSVVASEARLACYDRATEALDRARKREDLVIVDRAQMQKTREALFGFTLPRIKIFGETHEDAPVKAIDAKVMRVQELGYGKSSFSLSDGSVWQLTEASPDASFIKTGDGIKIQSGILGSYNAVIGSSRFKVKRTK